jgi:isoleucyl-tRNA synthetase
MHRWAKIEKILLVTNGTLEIARRDKKIGTGLDAELTVYITDDHLASALEDMDQQTIADIFRVSRASIVQGVMPSDATQFVEVLNVAAIITPLTDHPKCARSWRRVPDVGSDPDYPDLSARDADAVRWWDAQR